MPLVFFVSFSILLSVLGPLSIPFTCFGFVLPPKFSLPILNVALSRALLLIYPLAKGEHSSIAFLLPRTTGTFPYFTGGEKAAQSLEQKLNSIEENRHWSKLHQVSLPFVRGYLKGCGGSHLCSRIVEMQKLDGALTEKLWGMLSDPPISMPWLILRSFTGSWEIMEEAPALLAAYIVLLLGNDQSWILAPRPHCFPCTCSKEAA